MLIECSSRVMSEFQQGGYLQPHTNLQQAPQGQLSIAQLVSFQWDRNLRPRAVVPVPGLFLDRHPEDINHGTLVQMIANANPSALSTLGRALAALHDGAMNVLEQTKSTNLGVRNTAFGTLGTMANRRNREASAARVNVIVGKLALSAAITSALWEVMKWLPLRHWFVRMLVRAKRGRKRKNAEEDTWESAAMRPEIFQTEAETEEIAARPWQAPVARMW